MENERKENKRELWRSALNAVDKAMSQILAKDLRIGNKVGFYKSMLRDIQAGTVTEIYRDDNEYRFIVPEFSPVHSIGETALSGIHLTPEILEKCVFSEFFMYEVTYNKEVFKEHGNAVFWLVPKNDKVYFALQVNSLHQLQNAYWILNNFQDLEVNL